MTHWIENTYSILLEVPEGMTPEQYVEAHRIPSTGFIDLADKTAGQGPKRVGGFPL